MQGLRLMTSLRSPGARSLQNKLFVSHMFAWEILRYGRRRRGTTSGVYEGPNHVIQRGRETIRSSISGPQCRWLADRSCLRKSSKTNQTDKLKPCVEASTDGEWLTDNCPTSVPRVLPCLSSTHKQGKTHYQNVCWAVFKTNQKFKERLWQVYFYSSMHHATNAYASHSINSIYWLDPRACNYQKLPAQVRVAGRYFESCIHT